MFCLLRGARGILDEGPTMATKQACMISAQDACCDWYKVTKGYPLGLASALLLKNGAALHAVVHLQGHVHPTSCGAMRLNREISASQVVTLRPIALRYCKRRGTQYEIIVLEGQQGPCNNLFAKVTAAVVGAISMPHMHLHRWPLHSCTVDASLTVLQRSSTSPCHSWHL